MDSSLALKEEKAKNDTLFSIVQILSCDIDDVHSKMSNNKIAIYGIGRMGEALFSLCKKLNIKVSYAIDKNGCTRWNGIDVIQPNQDFSPVDMIVISVDSDYLEIVSAIRDKGIPFRSINEFIMDIVNEPFEIV